MAVIAMLTVSFALLLGQADAFGANMAALDEAVHAENQQHQQQEQQHNESVVADEHIQDADDAQDAAKNADADIVVLAADGSSSEEAETPFLRSIQMKKQYVPVVKEGKTVAYKTSYFGSINVGASPEWTQAFTVVFDTGSGHLVLPSTVCASETCMKHRRYNRSLSSSAIDIDGDGRAIQSAATDRDQLSIAFGTGEVMGEFVQDIMCLDPKKETCVKMRIVLATEMTEDPFGLFDFDGVLGLGLNALTLDPHFSFFGQLMKQYPSMKPLFSVFMAQHDGGDSIVSFGGYEEARATSPLKWAPVIMQDQGYWLVHLKGVRIGDTPVPECEDGSCRAILDTGTSLLGVPRELTRGMHRLLARPVPEEQMESDDIDCREVPGQKMHFDLGDDNIVSLQEEDYSRPIPFNMTLPNRDDGAWRLFCRSLLLPIDMEEPVGPRVFIWGEPVLRRYYTVYDMVEKKIGFTKARDIPEQSTGGLPPVDAPPVGSITSGSPIRIRKPSSPESPEEISV